MKKSEFEKRWAGYRTKCWMWQLCCNERGYGRKHHRGKTRKAHRVYFELRHGVELTPEEQLDHKCRNIKCVNPDHLEIVTNLENQKRRARITPEVAEQIISLKGKMSQEKIAEMFGFSRRYIRDIHAGRLAEWQ